MRKVKLAAATSLFLSTLAFAQPANALFGLVCIPSLYNCMCTFMVPCPVTDPIAQAQNALENSGLKNALDLMQQVQHPQEMIIKALNGTGGFSIPGVNTIGINLQGVLPGSFNQLGIPNGISNIAQGLTKLGINSNMLTSLASGKLTPQDFLTVAKNAGVNFNILSQAGLSMNTIDALASGKLDPSQVLSLGQKLGIQGGVLSDLGITQQLLTDISNGKASPQQLLNVAKNAGLNVQALASVGLDQNALLSLKNGGPSALMDILQKAGYDSSPITSLGLNAGMLGQIATGKLPPSAIADLVKGTGIDPSAIVIPGLNGPISMPGSTPLAQSTMVTVPLSSVPGLQNAMNIASGAGVGTGGPFGATSTATGAMCSSSGSLISVGQPPNGFGSDPSNIDMAISGGSIDSFPEAATAVESADKATFTMGAARAIVERPLLGDALKAIDSFQNMMDNTKSVRDDLSINDTIKSQLMTARAETTDMYTVLASVRAATKMNSHYISATPLFPDNSRFQSVLQSKATQAAATGAISSQALTGAATDLSKIENDAASAIANHNLLVEAKVIEAGLPSMYAIIDNHENYKTFLYGLEQIIRSDLSTLYGQDGSDHAWTLLQKDLYSDAGSYYDPNKWTTGYQFASELSASVTAQTLQTKYGTRVQLTQAAKDQPAQFSEVKSSAYSYPAIDSYAGSQGDAYRVINPETLGNHGSKDGNQVQIQPSQALVGVLQYYLETLRREEDAATLRRGTGAHTMTSAFWNEMVTNAPQCLSGPIPFSVKAVQDRPEMFDLSKTCEHLTWSFGDPGDYIDAGQLGGADAALWLSKITLAKVADKTGGPAAVNQQLQSILTEISASNASSTLIMQGQPEAAQYIDQIKSAVASALSDSGDTQQIDMPPPTQTASVSP